MLSLDEYLAKPNKAHGHLCAGRSWACAWPCWDSKVGIETLAVKTQRLVRSSKIDRLALPTPLPINRMPSRKRA